MPSLSWQKGPLGEEVERKLATKLAEGDGWERGLANWDVVQQLSTEKHNAFTEFLSTLSISQRNSLLILLDWWNGMYDKTDMQRARRAIRDHATGSYQSERFPRGLDLTASKYQEKLFDLFLYEFFFYEKSTAAPIQLRRHHASLSAACQRLAFSTYAFYMDAIVQTHASSTTEVSQINRNLDVMHPARRLSDVGKIIPGAIIEPCPWLPSQKKEGSPYYLWDLENKRTVVVDELPEVPAYAAISHTWGRWRIPGDGVVISGVPWKVPQTSRFDVEDLPCVLCNKTSIFAPTRFIWLDLFCIPQDRSDRAVIEIAKQAAIFGAAAEAFIWLNDITEWAGVQAAIQWLAVDFLNNTTSSSSYDTQRVLLKVNKTPTSGPHLFQKFDLLSDHIGVGDGPSGWFTSLWTLQESCLRPEMKLCNRRWEILRICDAPSALPVPLDSILALADHYQKKELPETGHDNDEMPAGVIELCALLEHTRLTELLQYSPLAVLVLGNHRECSERRAEAIMSIIGATDWYMATDRISQEKNLVFSKYPIQFLREVRQNLGADFFASNYGVCCYWDIFQRNDDGELDAVIAGTLLPFDPLRGQSKFVLGADSPDRFDHPTTEKWDLGDDGRVLVPEAGIVASTISELDIGTNQTLIATVIGPVSEDQPEKTDLPKEVNLHDWMRAIFADVPKVAVCLRQDVHGWSQGAILMAVFEDEVPLKTFAKLADFYTKRHDGFVEPRGVLVNWEIF